MPAEPKMLVRPRRRGWRPAADHVSAPSISDRQAPTRLETVCRAPERPRVARSFTSISAAVVMAALLTACGGQREADVCANADRALTRAGFIFVQAPKSGERVSSGFEVTGCSSTFEASVNWRIRGRDGEALASGSTQG